MLPLVLICLALFDAASAEEVYGTCRSLGDTATKYPGVEDFRFVSEDLVILGAGPLLPFLIAGDAAGGDGALVALDLKTERTREVVLEGYPSGGQFRPHGLDYSAKNSLLYVVNHQNLGAERVDVFKVKQPKSFKKLRLVWQRTLNVPAGPVLNSVTEVSKDDVYVTQFLAGQGFTDGNGQIGKFTPELIGSQDTGVWHCRFSTGQCDKAFWGMFFANGITASPNRDLFFVVDTATKQVLVLTRGKDDFKLAVKGSFLSPHTADNIELGRVISSKPGKGVYKLWLGAIGVPFDQLLTATVIPSGLTVAIYDEAANTMVFKSGAWEDGSYFHSVANAAKWNGFTLLSGNNNEGGVLLCK